jgi:hypothetical protein
MHLRPLSRILVGLVMGAALLLLFADGIGASTTSFNALASKRVPGSLTTWSPIQRVLFPSSYFPQSVRESLVTASVADANFPSIAFVLFKSDAAAKAYYEHPGPNLAANRAWQRPLSGPAPAAIPSRWIDLKQCLYLGGPNPRNAPQGAPASSMRSNGTCPVGSPVAVGIDRIPVN